MTEPNDIFKSEKTTHKTLFIVVGTGFLGKVLIEKLLRATEVGKIYVLIRGKKGVNPKDRVLKMIEDPVSILRRLLC